MGSREGGDGRCGAAPGREDADVRSPRDGLAFIDDGPVGLAEAVRGCRWVDGGVVGVSCFRPKHQVQTCSHRDVG